MIALLIGLGGAMGAVLRYQLSIFLNKSFPFGTLLINSIGSFLLSVLFSLHINGAISDWIWFLVGVGFLGAFTTFSTFSFEIIQLVLSGKKQLGIFYLIITIITGIGFVFLGLKLV